MLTAAVYWPGLHGGYVFDDFANIVDNASLRVTFHDGWARWLGAAFSSPASDLPRPLAMLSFALNRAASGLDPFWMKATNLAIHLVNTVLVLGLGLALLGAAARRVPTLTALRRRWIALWIAAAWALAPINLMPVLLVVQRMEALSHTFVFGGLWLYALGRERLRTSGRGWYMILAALAAGTGLGVLAKESAALLPLYALLFEWIVLDFTTSRRPRDPRLFWLFGVVLALPACLGSAWLLPRVVSVGAFASRDFTLAQRLMTEARIVVDYAHWTLLPNLSQLSLYHDDYGVSRGLFDPPSTAFSVLALGAAAGAVVGWRKKHPLLALGIGWFLAAQLLTATFLPLELVFEHRNYFASLGLCLAVASVCLVEPQRPAARKAGMVMAVLLVALYAGLTGLRAREWSDQLRFALTEAAKHPHSPRATYDVARDMVIMSGYDPASPWVPRAFSALGDAMRAPGATALPDAAAIMLASRTGRPVALEWWHALQVKLGKRTLDAQGFSAIAALVDCQVQAHCAFDTRQMVATLDIAMGPSRDPKILSMYGNYALNVLKDPGRAERLWKEAATRSPNVVEYQVTMARMSLAMDRYDEAALYIDRIRRIGRLGQYEPVARELERLAVAGRRSGPPGRKPDQSSRPRSP